MALVGTFYMASMPILIEDLAYNEHTPKGQVIEQIISSNFDTSCTGIPEFSFKWSLLHFALRRYFDRGLHGQISCLSYYFE